LSPILFTELGIKASMHSGRAPSRSVPIAGFSCTEFDTRTYQTESEYRYAFAQTCNIRIATDHFKALL